MRPPTPSPLGATSRARRAVLIGAAIVPLLLATPAALAATLEPTTSGPSSILPVGVEPPPGPPAPDDYALCDHGHYSATGYGSVLKTAAPNGRTTKEGCESAKQGFHVPTEGATAQTECAVGTYQDERGKRLCKDAVAGQFVSTVRAKAPELCPAGTYGVKARAVSAADGCRPAEAGSFVANAGSAATTPCAAGTYQPDAGKTSCIAAAAGFFVPSAGAKSQTPCPTATTTGSKTCSAAAPAPEPPPTQESEDEDDEAVTDDGFVRPDGDPCPAGTWSPDGLVPTASSCTPASPGTFVSEAGAT